MKIHIQDTKMIDVFEWDRIVTETYGRTYSFQQQDGCKSRGIHSLTVPDEDYDYENDTIPEKVNGEEMGVSFKAWLERDPKQKLSNLDDQFDFDLELWWERNFYPDIQMIANDLHSKGILPAGDYVINIDW